MGLELGLGAELRVNRGEGRGAGLHGRAREGLGPEGVGLAPLFPTSAPLFLPRGPRATPHLHGLGGANKRTQPPPLSDEARREARRLQRQPMHVIGRAMYETSGLPPTWAESCNEWVDEVCLSPPPELRRLHPHALMAADPRTPRHRPTHPKVAAPHTADCRPTHPTPKTHAVLAATLCTAGCRPTRRRPQSPRIAGCKLVHRTAPRPNPGVASLRVQPAHLRRGGRRRGAAASDAAATGHAAVRRCTHDAAATARRGRLRLPLRLQVGGVQPYVRGGCNRTYRTLQPYVNETATVCDLGCHRIHFRSPSG